MRNFKDLEIWNIGMEIVVNTYNLTKELPNSEKFGLISQMRRSAVSISSNIAEGCSRSSAKDLSRFVEIAIGSSFELTTQFIMAQKVNYFDEIQLEQVLELLDKFQRKANRFRIVLINRIAKT